MTAGRHNADITKEIAVYRCPYSATGRSGSEEDRPGGSDIPTITRRRYDTIAPTPDLENPGPPRREPLKPSYRPVPRWCRRRRLPGQRLIGCAPSKASKRLYEAYARSWARIFDFVTTFVASKTLEPLASEHRFAGHTLLNRASRRVFALRSPSLPTDPFRS